MKWQPIETAPKDENSFLLFIPSKRRFPVKQGFWDKDHFRWFGCNSITEARRNQPTHWMRLPDPPEDAA